MSEPIIVKIPTDSDYWGGLAPTDDDLGQLGDIVSEIAFERGHKVSIKYVLENFSYENRNIGEAWDILDEAWWKFIH